MGTEVEGSVAEPFSGLARLCTSIASLPEPATASFVANGSQSMTALTHTLDWKP